MSLHSCSLHIMANCQCSNPLVSQSQSQAQEPTKQQSFQSVFHKILNLENNNDHLKLLGSTLIQGYNGVQEQMKTLASNLKEKLLCLETEAMKLDEKINIFEFDVQAMNSELNAAIKSEPFLEQLLEKILTADSRPKIFNIFDLTKQMTESSTNHLEVTLRCKKIRQQLDNLLKSLPLGSEINDSGECSYTRGTQTEMEGDSEVVIRKPKYESIFKRKFPKPLHLSQIVDSDEEILDEPVIKERTPSKKRRNVTKTTCRWNTVVKSPARKKRRMKGTRVKKHAEKTGKDHLNVKREKMEEMKWDKGSPTETQNDDQIKTEVTVTVAGENIKSEFKHSRESQECNQKHVIFETMGNALKTMKIECDLKTIKTEPDTELNNESGLESPYFFKNNCT